MNAQQLLTGFAWLAAAFVLRADVTVPPLFAPHAILQHGQAVPVWGRADAGEVVAVSYHDQRVETITGADGRWRVELAPLPPRLTGTLVIAGNNRLEFPDVLTGEVWVCSGQSNMEFSVRAGLDAGREIAAADFPQIRQFRVKYEIDEEPREVVEGAWAVCSPQTAGYFTAAGYFFAREIHQRYRMPVALINASKGSTSIEAWMSREAITSSPAFAVINERWAEILAKYPERQAAYERALAEWEAAAEQAAKKGEPAADPRGRPRPPGGPGHFGTPSGTFNTMVAPLMPYAIRGVLWYQGEGNHTRAPEYRDYFAALVHDWRAQWGQGALPFYFVQIARYEMPTDHSRVKWAYLREAQTQSLALPHTGMAVAMDVGETDDIHPRNKQEVGRRLALIARAQLYGEQVAFSSPLPERSLVENNRLKIEFAHAERGLKTSDGRPVATVLVAGADRVFFPAHAEIEDGSLWVWSDAVARPVAARYAWSNDPSDANLVSSEGLPVPSFRTDAWPDFPDAAR